MMKYTLIISLILTAFLFSGCAPKLYMPAQQHVDWVSSTYNYSGTIEEFEQARTMYTQYCQSCHDLHMPNEYTISEWEPIYAKMSLNISVPESTKRKIYYYIIAGAKDAKPVM